MSSALKQRARSGVSDRWLLSTEAVSWAEPATVYPTVTPVAEDAGPQEWLGDAMERLEELLALPKNWDSYGAPPVSPRAAEAAINLLGMTFGTAMPAPQIVPTRSGGLQLEWHTGGVDAELVIDSAGRSYELSWEDESGSSEEAADDLGQIAPIQTLIDRLSLAA